MSARGPYVLDQPLSSGRDGSAFLARLGERPCVVRIVSALRDDPARWATLRHRLGCVRMLDVPGLLAVLDADLDAETPWIAVERTHGVPLAEALDEPFALSRALALCVQLSRALVHGHSLGLAHGKLMPSTIRIAPDDSPSIDLLHTDTGEVASGILSHAALSGTLAPLDARCGPPPDQLAADPREADVFSLAALFVTLRTGVAFERSALGEVAGGPLAAVLANALADDPSARPAMIELLRALVDARADASLANTKGPASTPVDRTILDERGGTPLETHPGESPPDDGMLSPGDRLGRFELSRTIGAGGMGAVYLATDLADGATVAVKVMTPRGTDRRERDRFRKEARMLRTLRSPNIANLIEVNEDGPYLFMAMDFVDGPDLGQVLDVVGRLPWQGALRVAMETSAALGEAHRRGVVHRDIKPGNLLLEGAPRDPAALTDTAVLASARVRVIDFGLAREIDQSQSLALTRTGAIMGSPAYMSPEQCGTGDAVGPASDVYSIGATLFVMLTGRTVFTHNDAMRMLVAHCTEAPVDPRSLVPDVPEALAKIVARCLAKKADERYVDAFELSRALEDLQGADTTAPAAQPRLPPHDPDRLVENEIVVDFEVSPETVWPEVSNTDRINAAIGFPAVRYTLIPDDPPGFRRFRAESRIAGLPVRWIEEPFEWIEGQRFAVLRRFESGPLDWYLFTVALERRPGGTRLVQRIVAAPANTLGRGVAVLQVRTLRRRFVRVYERIGQVAAGQVRGDAALDPFDGARHIDGRGERRLDAIAARIVADGGDPEAVAAIATWIRHAPARDAAHIRPRALARSLGLPESRVIEVCIRGVVHGLFTMLWDILCPTCQVPSEALETLRRVQSHGRCDVCDLDYDVDFADSVELVFRVMREIRPVEPRIYCIGGPGHAPHVAAQVRIAPGERVTWSTRLDAGAYRVQSRQLPGVANFRVRSGGESARLDLKLLPTGYDTGGIAVLALERQVFAIENLAATELLVRVERRVGREDALTAAQASMLPIFRAAFPEQILDPSQRLAVHEIVLLRTRYCAASELFERAGDAGGFELLSKVHDTISDAVVERGGNVVRTDVAEILARFPDLDTALSVAGELGRLDAPIACAVVAGAAIVTSLHGAMDFYGLAPHACTELLRTTPAGWLAVNARAAQSPVVEQLAPIEREVVTWGETWGVRLRLRDAEP